MSSIERSSRLERIAGMAYFVLLSVWFCLNLAGQFTYQPTEFDRPPDKRVHLDYIRFYAIAPVVLSSERKHIYDPAVQLAAVNRVVPQYKWDQVFFMENPPYVFFLAAPFAGTSILNAYWMQMAISFVLGCAGILLLSKDKPTSYKLALIVGLNASWAAWDCYTLGQLGLVLFAAEALFFWALLRDRDWLAGFALALTSIKPQYLPFLGLPVLTTRRWMVVAAAAATETLLLGLSALWFGWRNVIEYPAMLSKFYQSMLCKPGTIAGFMNEKFLTMRVSVSGPLHLLLSKQLSSGLSTMIFLTSLALLLWVWLRAGNDKQKWPWAIALTVVASVVFAMHVFLYDCCSAIIAIIVTLSVLNPVRAWRTEPVSLKIWSVLLIVYPLISFAIIIWETQTQGYLARSVRNILYCVYHLIIFSAGMTYYWKHVLQRTPEACLSTWQRPT